jgi:hypothetical protein
MLRRLMTCAAVLLACARGAGATTLVSAGLGDLARDASAIARGRVVSVDGRWTADRRTIETLVTLDVAVYLKGTLGPTLQFRVPGGELGRYRRIFVGAPTFAVDEQVIVFLGAQPPVIPHVIGLSQGVFRLFRSSDGASWLVTPPVFPDVAVTTPVKLGDQSRRSIPLADFEQRVRSLAGGAR